jgi:hypothetical protein
MVHALYGIWRVLAGSGTLVDLRPLPMQCPVEAVTSDSVVQIGEVDATGMIADDAAADRAIRDVVEHGSFVPCRDIRFDFDFYWNSVPELASFIEGSKRMKQVVPSYAELEEVHRELSERSRAKVRLRCRRRTLLAVYAKAC